MAKNETSLVSKIITEDIREEYRDILIGLAISYLIRFLLLPVIKYLEKKEKEKQLLNAEKPNESKLSISKHKKPSSKIWILKKLRGGAFDILPLLELLFDVIPVFGAIGAFLVRKEEIVSRLYKNSPQNFPVKTRLSLEEIKDARESIDWVCDRSLLFLFDTLDKNSISYERQEALISEIFSEDINLKTDSARVQFVLCISAIMGAIYIPTPGSYIILSKALAKAVKEDKITKLVLRAILLQLRRKKLRIDPDLLDLVKLRGGSIWEPETFTFLEREKFLSSVDPIFTRIQFEKFKIALKSVVSKLNRKPKIKPLVRKVIKMLRRPIESKFLAYLVLGFLTLDSLEPMPGNPRSLTQEQKINSTSWLKKISEISEENHNQSSKLIQTGDKLLLISPEKIVEDSVKPVEEINTSDQAQTKNQSRPKKARKRRAKVVRFVDLPPLSNSDFPETLKQPESSSKIRIKNF